MVVVKFRKAKMSVWEWAIFDELRRMNARQMVYQVLNFAMIVSSALMIWKGLMVNLKSIFI